MYGDVSGGVEAAAEWKCLGSHQRIFALEGIK
jgi:hypothetical protein